MEECSTDDAKVSENERVSRDGRGAVDDHDFDSFASTNVLIEDGDSIR